VLIRVTSKYYVDYVCACDPPPVVSEKLQTVSLIKVMVIDNTYCTSDLSNSLTQSLDKREHS